MTFQVSQSSHWSSLYSSNLHDWHSAETAQGQVYFRRQGIVENLFDVDGVDYEGRADITITLDVELKTTLNHAQLRHRILQTWAFMRHRHVLISSTSQYASDLLNDKSSKNWLNRCFVYQPPSDVTDMINGATESITFVGDDYPEVDHEDFHIHVMNSARAIDETKSLARLFVMPIRQTASEGCRLRLVMIAAHQVADGITSFRWANRLIEILNWTQQELDAASRSICSDKSSVSLRLPPAQESLYPPVAGNTSISRWRWLVIRVLRHVRKTAPSAFQNPLIHDTPLKRADVLPMSYPTVLNYQRRPPLNCYTISADLSQRATHNLIRLCREARISIGSGCFTLVGIVMMRFEEMRHPDIPLQDRLPFLGSFPVNPRPFLSGTPTTGKEESLMLAFSEGVTLPFLPSDLNLSKSFRVLGRLAHRQLSQYQKRRRGPEEVIHLGTRSPSLLLPLLYLSTMERLNGIVQPAQRVGFDSQGQYTINKRFSPATCGVSSIGDRTNLISSGRYDLENLGSKDIAADFRNMDSCVRAREGEFLVGALGTKDSLHFMVSYDGSTIDIEKARQWKAVIETILDCDLQATAEVAAAGRPKL